MRPHRLLTAMLVLTLAATACSGDSETTTTVQATTTTKAVTETTSPPETTIAASGAVDSLADVRGAIIRIVAEGSFVDPEFGEQFNAAGSGSGFFIDESGIAVTNNHVVTGAAFLQVYVEGEEDPLNARVLGVSECSDLAVIEVEGDGFPYLDWYDGELAVGTEIFAAGFPLGDDEYTLLEGIISKERADGESDWASVDAVIEHSADTLPGNSGGPIVTADGKVVAVNYAGNNAGQAFAIGRDEALEVIPTLQSGENVTSIGINGQAIYDDFVPGIWVASVASGSAADLGGVKAGDLVTRIEGLIPATDGTMADYCDILRSHEPTDPLSVEVYRASEEAFLEGTLNTDKLLDVSYSFASELGDEVVDDGSAGGAGYSYVSLSDDQGIITVSVPEQWSDLNTTDLWDWNGEQVGVAISAATNIDDWYSGWVTPGMFFGASTTLTAFETIDSVLDGHDFSSECDFDGRIEYSDPLYAGAYDKWLNCGGTDNLFITLAAQPPTGDVLLVVQVVAISDADLEALDAVLASFIVDEVALAAFSGTLTSTVSPGTIDDFANLWPGECFNPANTTFDEVLFGVDVEVVSCSTPHVGEVFGNYFIPDADSTPFPGEAAVDQIGAEFCGPEFEAYVGSTYAESSLDYWWYYPGEVDWNNGRGFVMCALVDWGGGNLVGSAAGSGW